MDVKTAFLNGNIDETIYMVQPENFESNDSKQLVCKLKGSIYGLKQASRQWYQKFVQIHRDRSRGILRLSQKAYIDKVLSRFGMSNCALWRHAVAKGDKFSLHQCPKNELEKKDMERFPIHLEIVGYLDSDFAGCLDSRRSTSGYIFMLVGGAVSWKSVKQTLIASSTMKANS
ncbi:hypothetical protein AAG906_017839 [Vitis piasezkii]